MASPESFDADFDACLAGLHEARGRLLQDVRRLDGHALVQRRRGGWSVGEVLRHLADSEASYAQAVGLLRSRDVAIASASDDDVASTGAIVLTLERTRRALLDAIDGVDEDRPSPAWPRAVQRAERAGERRRARRRAPGADREDARRVAGDDT